MRGSWKNGSGRKYETIVICYHRLRLQSHVLRENCQTVSGLFTLKYILCRSEEKAAKVHGETGFPTTVSDEDCKNSKPDFVVVAVNKGNIADVAEKWALMGYPVLTETPIGCSLKQLKDESGN